MACQVFCREETLRKEDPAAYAAGLGWYTQVGRPGGRERGLTPAPLLLGRRRIEGGVAFSGPFRASWLAAAIRG
jgi:hypothetical protein